MKTLNDGPYIAKLIKKQLDLAKKKVKETDQDRVYLITGNEGSGKSTLAMQLAYYLDNKFNLNNITFNSKHFADRIRNAEKYSVIVFDEAFNGLSSRGVLSSENKRIIRLLQECRQRNLFIFIVLPSIFLLEKYVALFRSHGLFHCSISRKSYKDRYFKIYNRHNKQLLYILGKKLMSYSKPYIPLMHTFHGKYPPTIDKEEYNKKKLEAFQEEKEKEKTINDKWMIQRDALIRFLKNKLNYPTKDIEKEFITANASLGESQIRKIAQETPKTREILRGIYYN